MYLLGARKYRYTIMRPPFSEHLSLPHLTRLLTTAPCPSQAFQLHSILTTAGLLRHSLLHTQLINLYANLDLTSHALSTFHSIKPHTNVVTWTSLISHLAHSSSHYHAVSLFPQLLRAGISPNAFTFSALLPAFAATFPSPRFAPQPHVFIYKLGLGNDVFVTSALADFYAKCNDMLASKKVFDEMPVRNLVSWNSVIVGFAQNEMYNDAMELFRELLSEHDMQLDEVSFSSVIRACANSDGGGMGFGRQVHGRAIKQGLEAAVYVRNSLIDMYGKCGFFSEAFSLFSAAENRDVVTWNVLMMSWVQCDGFEEARICFRDMRRDGITPDEASFSTVLHAAASLATWSDGAAVHNQIIKIGFSNNQCVGNSLIIMYAKCGNLDDAHRVFLEAKDCQSVVSWTAMITAFQQHGRGDCVIRLFEEMVREGIQPDNITMVSVLSACSHNGLVEQGFSYISQMSPVYGLVPGNEHYACIVDMLGRAKRLDEAKSYIDTMPITPDASVWGAMLAACRNCGDLENGKVAAEKLFEIEAHNPGNYILLANMYSYHGKLKEAKGVRKLMKLKGVRKETGCSWIEVKSQTFVFRVHDQSHSRTEEIYMMLRKMEQLVKEKGYVADTRFAVNAVDDYKEQNLWYHSERLALAFGLLYSPEDIPINIKKNLRTCGDCHLVMKFASEIFKREIVLRDINRFHRFTNGSCSCGDYW